MEKGFEQLIVWQQAKALAVSVYRECRKPPLRDDRTMRDQMQRAALSVSSNIAEGGERDSTKEELRYLSIAKASTAELRSQLLVGEEIGLIEPSVCKQLCDQCRKVGFLLVQFMRYKKTTLPLPRRQTNPAPPRPPQHPQSP